MSHDTGNKQKLSSLSRIAPYLVLAVMLALSVWSWRFLASIETTKARRRKGVGSLLLVFLGWGKARP